MAISRRTFSATLITGAAHARTRVNPLTTSISWASITAASLLIVGVSSAYATGSAQSPAQAQGYNAVSMKDDLAHRSPDIHWPAGFAPAKAELFAHNTLAINASCEQVWGHIINVNQWPTWYPNSKDVEIRGEDPVLRNGTVFRWTTFGLAIESKVHEYVPNQRLGWYGYAPGAQPSFYHSWYLQPIGAGCHVVMDEVGIGKDAAALRQSDETLMHRGHDLWLATLKWVAETK
jgi:Polyketide cyclase / dehydrase and lipid transport